MRRLESTTNEAVRDATDGIHVITRTGGGPSPARRVARVVLVLHGRESGFRIRRSLGALVLLAATAAGCGGGRARDAFSTPALEHRSSPVVTQARDAGSPVFHVYDPRHEGVIQTDLTSAAAVFERRDEGTLVVHVASGSVAQLVALLRSELATSRRVVLDSDGDEEGKRRVSDIARAATGGGPKTEGALIFAVEEGVYAVTPLETAATHRRRESLAGKPLPVGNTARYALGLE